MLTAQVIQNLSRNLARYALIEEQLSSARRINRPSDDPIGTVRVLEYRHELTAIEQYKKDVQFGQTWLGSTDSSLADVNSQLIEAFDIVVNLSNDTIGDDQRDSLAGRVDAIIAQVLQAANATVGGRHIFSGTMTDVAAITASSTGVMYNGNTSIVRTKIGNGNYIDLNSIGMDVFTRAFTTLGKTFDLKLGLTPGALLSDLNSELGIQQSPGVFRIVDRNGTAVANIDISAATSVGDVLNAINTGLASAGITNVTASISPAGDGIRLEATPTGLISGNTLLKNLNNGNGVDLVPGTFTMRKSDGSASVEVDLSGATTVQDMMSTFNSTMAAAGFGSVVMFIGAGNRGLEVVDTAFPPNAFEFVESTATDTTAADLGFTGVISDFITGADLNPQPDFEVLDLASGVTTAADLGLVGRFNRTLDGKDINPVLTISSRIADLNNGLGFELGRVRIASGHQTATVDLSTATTINDVIVALSSTGLPVAARINAAGTGIEVYPTAANRSLIVTSDSARTAENLGIVGSPDLFGSLYLLRQALQANDGEMVRTTNESIQGALDQILFERSNVGARQIRLETTDFRLLDQELNVTRLRSQYEDADILAVSSELAKQESVYQAALAAAARMIQPSLAQFLG
jgi:flagellin-like hook-associated protein FlgL